MSNDKNSPNNNSNFILNDIIKRKIFEMYHISSDKQNSVSSEPQDDIKVLDDNQS